MTPESPTPEVQGLKSHRGHFHYPRECLSPETPPQGPSGPGPRGQLKGWGRAILCPEASPCPSSPAAPRGE